MKLNKFLVGIVITLFILVPQISLGASEYASLGTYEYSSPVAAEADNGNICLSVDDSKRLVVELEKGRINEKSLEMALQINAELARQVELERQATILAEEKYQESVKLQAKTDDLNKQKFEAINKELEEAKKPRWGAMGATFGLGALMMGALILFL